MERNKKIFLGIFLDKPLTDGTSLVDFKEVTDTLSDSQYELVCSAKSMVIKVAEGAFVYSTNRSFISGYASALTMTRETSRPKIPALHTNN